MPPTSLPGCLLSDIEAIPDRGTPHRILSCYELFLLIVWDALQRLSVRVMEYLWGRVERTLDPWERDDVRMAYIIVYLVAEEKSSRPYDVAFNRVVGGFPRKVVPQILAESDRLRAVAGPALGDEQGAPKKPAQSERWLQKRRTA